MAWNWYTSSIDASDFVLQLCVLHFWSPYFLTTNLCQPCVQLQPEEWERKPYLPGVNWPESVQSFLKFLASVYISWIIKCLWQQRWLLSHFSVRPVRWLEGTVMIICFIGKLGADKIESNQKPSIYYSLIQMVSFMVHSTQNPFQSLFYFYFFFISPKRSVVSKIADGQSLS